MADLTPYDVLRCTMRTMYDADSGEDSTWMRLFRNARTWVG